MAGYIKIHRKITDWEWYKDINTTRLFIHLLLIANFKDTRYKGKTIPRGSTATTVARLADETGLTIKEVRTGCKHLMNTGEISIKTTNRESIINVHNYGIYQSIDDDEGQTEGKQRATQGQPKGERTEEEGKEREEGKKKDLSLSTERVDVGKFSESSDEMKLSLLLLRLMRKNNPSCREPNLQSWCRHVDLMIRRDGRSPKEIQDVIVFSQADSFWHSNILSTKKLREKYDQLSMKMNQVKTQPIGPKVKDKSFAEIISERMKS